MSVHNIRTGKIIQYTIKDQKYGYQNPRFYHHVHEEEGFFIGINLLISKPIKFAENLEIGPNHEIVKILKNFQLIFECSHLSNCKPTEQVQ